MATRPWPAPFSIRLACEGSTAKGVNWANIFWLKATGSTTPTVAQCATAAATWYAAYANDFMALLGKDGHLLRAVVNWYGNSPDQVVGDHIASTPGGSANNTEVDSLSAAVSWQFGQTWRGGKPRTYLPCLPTEAFADSNTLDSSFITAVQTAATSFTSTLGGAAPTPFGTTALGVMSFFSGNAPRSAGVFFPYTGNVVHARIDSMRRRLGREVT